MNEIKDKRVAVREPVHLVAEIELAGENVGCAVSRNASGNGFLLLTHLDLGVNSLLDLRIYVPKEETPRTLRARVVRSEKIPATEGLVWAYRSGVELSNPPPDLQQLIEQLSRKPA